MCAIIFLHLHKVRSLCAPHPSSLFLWAQLHPLPIKSLRLRHQLRFKHTNDEPEFSVQRGDRSTGTVKFPGTLINSVAFPGFQVFQTSSGRPEINRPIPAINSMTISRFGRKKTGYSCESHGFNIPNITVCPQIEKRRISFKSKVLSCNSLLY